MRWIRIHKTDVAVAGDQMYLIDDDNIAFLNPMDGTGARPISSTVGTAARRVTDPRREGKLPTLWEEAANVCAAHAGLEPANHAIEDDW